jgi:uncharacterized protein YecA (UPF0149 family)
MTKRDDAFTERFKEHRRKEAEYKKQLPADDEPPLPPPVEPIHRASAEIGRNDPCPCGSGKKFKQCCLKKQAKK